MGEVVDLHADKKMHVGQPKTQTESERIQAADDRRERADRLKRKIEDNAAMSRNDQESVARELGKLMERCGSLNFRKSAVLVKAGIGNPDDPTTKHLSQYAIMPHQVEDRPFKGRLTKKPRPYGGLIKAFSFLAGEDEDRLLLQAFAGTALCSEAPVGEGERAYEELAHRLRSIISAIAAKHELQSYFKSFTTLKPTLGIVNYDEIERIGHELETNDIELSFHLRDSIEIWPVELRARCDLTDYENYGSVPSYPTVILGKWEGPYGLVVDVTSNAAEPLPKEASRTYARLRFELQLCIVPVGEDFRPTGALRVSVSTDMRSYADLTQKNARAQETVSFGTDDRLAPGSTVKGWVKIHASSKIIECQFAVQMHEQLDPLIAALGIKDTVVGGYRFLPITAGVCRDWFAFEDYEQMYSADWKLPHKFVLGEAVIDNSRDVGYSELPAQTIAAALDCALSGQIGPDLLSIFDFSAGRLVSLLDEAKSEGLAARDEGYAKLDARLRLMRHSDKQDPSDK